MSCPSGSAAQRSGLGTHLSLGRRGRAGARKHRWRVEPTKTGGSLGGGTGSDLEVVSEELGHFSILFFHLFNDFSRVMGRSVGPKNRVPWSMVH